MYERTVDDLGPTSDWAQSFKQLSMLVPCLYDDVEGECDDPSLLPKFYQGLPVSPGATRDPASGAGDETTMVEMIETSMLCVDPANLHCGDPVIQVGSSAPRPKPNLK